ncbi:hypothetical protein B0T17DRAFT_523851 [Bombardia bombarda]|uniref:CST complex subunit Stn1 N-terminal domain-containing protein n=1 Tax=Bombardia bombarda TaxID=252184 RepID=A0AA39X7X6_9PEZI|nr:hypothetical protein B0T17DRAFT_523851 [Bombardia bombarda]
MTSAEQQPEIYPKYCFHLAPTIDRWCHLRIADIVALACIPGFEGQNIYFHLNHPIKWARVAGVVVALDEFQGRRVYTIDDSSGATIECNVNIPVPDKPGQPQPQPPAAANRQSTTAAATATTKIAIVDGDIDVGHVIDIKGSIGIFRGNRRIMADKIVHLPSTEHEVRFWDKVVQLKKEVLERPWVLHRREIRRCRKEAEGASGGDDKRRAEKSKRHASAAAAAAAARTADARSHLKKSAVPEAVVVPAKTRMVRVSGLEKKPKRPKPALPVTGKYDALGL